MGSRNIDGTIISQSRDSTRQLGRAITHGADRVETSILVYPSGFFIPLEGNGDLTTKAAGGFFEISNVSTDTLSSRVLSRPTGVAVGTAYPDNYSQLETGANIPVHGNPFILNDGAGNLTYLSQGSYDGLALLGTALNAEDGILSCSGIKVKDGTAAIPSIKVGDEQNGLYSPSANRLGATCGGTVIFQITTGGVLLEANKVLRIADGGHIQFNTADNVFLGGDNSTSGLLQLGTAANLSDGELATGAISVTDGSAAAPSIKVGDEENGLYSPGVSQVGLVAGGISVLQSTTGTMTLFGGASIGIGVLYGRGGALQGFKRIIEATTAGSGAPHVLNDSLDPGLIITNEGSTSQNYQSLPTAVAGLTYTFVVQDSDGMRVVASAGDTIRYATTVSASGGYIESTTVGDVATLVAINATEWYVTSVVGSGWLVT